MTEQEKINEIGKELFAMMFLSEMLSQNAEHFLQLGVRNEIKFALNSMVNGHNLGIKKLKHDTKIKSASFSNEMQSSEEKIRSLNVIFKILIMQNEELLSNYEDALVNLVKSKQDETNTK